MNLAGRLLFSVLITWYGAIAAPTAERVFLHGAIYTVDAARSWAEAIAIANGKILFVGSDQSAKAFIGPATTVVDLKGRMVLPAFHDSHVHTILGGQQKSICELQDAKTSKQAIQMVRICAGKAPGTGWLKGAGWELPLFTAANPRKELLDEFFINRPIFLKAADGHSAWVNSKALKIAGITKNTPDPPRGRIERDSATGEPSGTLRETAVALVSSKMPRPSAEDLAGFLRRGLEELNGFGIVSFQDPNLDEDYCNAYLKADREAWLSARVVGALRASPLRGLEQVEDLVSMRARFSGKRFKPTAAKIFADGVLESGTAAVLEPYLDRLAGQSGNLNYTPEQLNPLVLALEQADFQIHVHAIGDRAVRVTLDAFEEAQTAIGERDLRPQIAHLEMIEATDIPRFRKLHVSAGFQPLWAQADSYIRELTWPILGPARSLGLYPIGSIARTGAIIAAGSDWNVSSPNPLQGMQVGVTRRGIDAESGPAWLPNEQVDLATMIAAYTIHGAWNNHEENMSGSLEKGKSADLVVLSNNLFDVPPSHISKTRVLLTMLEGTVIWHDPSFSPDR